MLFQIEITHLNLKYNNEKEKDKLIDPKNRVETGKLNY